MNYAELPEIEKMSIEEAKSFILSHAKFGGESHDVHIDALADLLLEAADKRKQAAALMSGQTQIHYGGSRHHETATWSRILYDAVWELVMEGILRPGRAHFGSLNPRADGYCLTEKGVEALAPPN